MSKFLKVMIIIASSLVGIGILSLVLSLTLGGPLVFRPVEFNTGVIKTEEVTSTFKDVDIINIGEISNNVYFTSSDNDEIKVTYHTSEYFGYKISQKDNTLSIVFDDYNNRPWFSWFSMEEHMLTVELPEKVMEKIIVTTVSGDVNAADISSNFTDISSTSGSVKLGSDLGELTVNTTSGDVFFDNSATADSADIITTSGEIRISGNFKDSLKAKATSGDIEMIKGAVGRLGLMSSSGDVTCVNVKADTVFADTMSGDISFDDVICSGEMELETTSGEINIDRVDANDYDLKTVSGEIEAEILSPKFYNVRSVSGSANTPNNSTADKITGSFNAETTSGDIEVEVVR